jgi:ADP-heptose:LPS heptosyltransferase
MAIGARFWSYFDSVTSSLIQRRAGSKVAILRLDAIGDFVLWQPYARFFRLAFPNREIVLICNATYQELALQLPYWDRVIAINVTRFQTEFRYRIRVFRELRSTGFEVTLHPVYSRTFQADLLVRAMATPVRIGMHGDKSNQPLKLKEQSDLWYTRLIEGGHDLQPEWNRSRAFSQAILQEPIPWQRPFIEQLAARTFLDKAASYFVLFPGAASHGRRWPVERFIAVGIWLRNSRGWTPVVAGGTADAELASTLCAGLGPDAINLAGRTTVPEFVECIRHAKFVLSNETSAVHLAAATGTPAVAILGGGHFGRFLPYPRREGMILPVAAYEAMSCYGCNWQCQFVSSAAAPKPCITGVSEEVVKALVEQALAIGHSIHYPSASTT